MKQPNILIILVDDMGYSDIGCYGSEIQTPNIDRLAAEGIQFTQMYNCGRCCPSRASLLTGLYPHQAGIGHMMGDLGHPGYQGYLNDECLTIAEVLKGAGYNTLMSGKWHVGGEYLPRQPENWRPGDKKHPTPLGRGFDRYYGILHGCCSYYNPHTLMRQDRLINIETDEFYFTDAITDEAVTYIDEYGNRDNPFFLYVSYTAPHWPLHALPEDIARYQGNYGQGWDRVRKDRYDRMVTQGIIDAKWPISPRDEQAPPWEEIKAKDWEDARMAVYAAQIDRMDQGVGRILAKLKSMNIEEDTLVMFLSDNGGCAEFLAEDGFVQYLLYPNRDGTFVRPGNLPGIMPGDEDTYMSYDLPWANSSNTPFRLYKHWVHEGGISTPFIIHWPAVISEHRLLHQSTHLIDIMATCVEAAGASYPEEVSGKKIHPLEGEGLMPVVRGEGWSRQKPIFWEHEGNCAIRQDNWKMVKKWPGPWELYNLEQDRTELDNLIGKNVPKASELEKLYTAWYQRLDIVPWECLIDIAPE